MMVINDIEKRENKNKNKNKANMPPLLYSA